MWQAIAVAIEGVAQGQTPFGACIVRDGKVIALAHNRVWDTCDPTAHAEVQAIRQASQGVDCIDLTGAVVYSTCEPCPMCFAACHWARVSRIVYAASIADAQLAGFNELKISNHEMKRIGGAAMEITDGVLRDQAVEMMRAWANENGNVY